MRLDTFDTLFREKSDKIECVNRAVKDLVHSANEQIHLYFILFGVKIGLDGSLFRGIGSH